MYYVRKWIIYNNRPKNNNTQSNYIFCQGKKLPITAAKTNIHRNSEQWTGEQRTCSNSCSFWVALICITTFKHALTYIQSGECERILSASIFTSTYTTFAFIQDLCEMRSICFSIQKHLDPFCFDPSINLVTLST